LNLNKLFKKNVIVVFYNIFFTEESALSLQEAKFVIDELQTNLAAKDSKVNTITFFNEYID